MAIKKYTNGSWVPASYRKYGTETDTITTLPVTIIGDGTPISSYVIKGNMEQSGTPTPSNPIYPSECGEKTENLFDENNQTLNKFITSTGILSDSVNHNVSDYVEINPSTYYTLSNAQVVVEGSAICNAFYDNNKTFISAFRNTNEPTTIISPNNAKYVRITIRKTLASNIMLVEGSTAPTSYIPYGYKLPITLGSTATNIYLGEVQTTRRIKKLVLDGTELWAKSSSGYNAFYFYMNSGMYPHPKLISSAIICNIATFTRIPDNYVRYPWFCLSDKSFGISTDSAVIGGTAVDDWKSYLAQQYAAGTPVTIWYVLAEPETGMVNEPIRKVGDYVDSVSGTNLATSGTAQEFDVGTTLKPSEVDLTYHGWHKHEDTKFTT